MTNATPVAPGDVALAADPRNPGEFLACLGLLRLADLDRGDNRPAACWDGDAFRVVSDTGLARRVDARVRAVVASLADRPAQRRNRSEVGEAAIDVATADGTVRLDWWPGPWKLWAGQMAIAAILGNLARTALPLLPLAAAEWDDPDEPPTALDLGYVLAATARPPDAPAGPGLDAAATWTALDVGFSLNDVYAEVPGSKVPVRPLVEILAAVGLSLFQPAVDRDAGAWAYATWDATLPAPYAAVAAAGEDLWLGADPGVRTRQYAGRFAARGRGRWVEYGNPVRTAR